ncbi:MAG: hypothetical protein EBU05_05460 [Chitinophagia bacterium]|nr:hypothetical protein [Chitinophagia bacterium]
MINTNPPIIDKAIIRTTLFVVLELPLLFGLGGVMFGRLLITGVVGGDGTGGIPDPMYVCFPSTLYVGAFLYSSAKAGSFNNSSSIIYKF